MLTTTKSYACYAVKMYKYFKQGEGGVPDAGSAFALLNLQSVFEPPANLQNENKHNSISNQYENSMCISSDGEYKMSAQIFRKIHAPFSKNMRGQNHVHRRGTAGRTDRQMDREKPMYPPNFIWGGGGMMMSILPVNGVH